MHAAAAAAVVVVVVIVMVIANIIVTVVIVAAARCAADRIAIAAAATTADAANGIAIIIVVVIACVVYIRCNGICCLRCSHRFRQFTNTCIAMIFRRYGLLPVMLQRKKKGRERDVDEKHKILHKTLSELFFMYASAENGGGYAGNIMFSREGI